MKTSLRVLSLSSHATFTLSLFHHDHHHHGPIAVVSDSTMPSLSPSSVFSLYPPAKSLPSSLDLGALQFLLSTPLSPETNLCPIFLLRFHLSLSLNEACNSIGPFNKRKQTQRSVRPFPKLISVLTSLAPGVYAPVRFRTNFFGCSEEPMLAKRRKPSPELGRVPAGS